MTEARSKRRVLPLIFIIKSFTKSLLIKLKDITLKKTRLPKIRTSRIWRKIDEQHKFSLDADFVHTILQKRKNGLLNAHIASKMI